MKLILKRIIGFFEFIIGVILLSFFASSLFFSDSFNSTPLQWKDIVRVPLAIMFGFGLIKYGWRWMFNIFDLFDEKELKPDDPYFKDAILKAQLNIDLFLSYLIKNIFESYVLVTLDKSKKKYKRIWAKAEYLDNVNIKISYYPSLISRFTRKIYNCSFPLNELEDWYIKKDDTIIGLYTIKALSDKAKDNGYNINKRTRRLITKIIN